MAGCDPFTEREMIAMIESRAFESGNLLRNQTLFALECATGGRVNELLKLKRGDVLDSLGRVRPTIVFTNTKNGESRTVPLINPFPRPFLVRWLRELETLGYGRRVSPLFPSPVRRGKPITQQRVGQIYRTAAEELKLPGRISTHSCRKTWARDTYRYYHSRQVSGEMIDPLVKLQEAGGWKTIEATRRYIAFMLGDVTDSQAALFPLLQERYGNSNKKPLSEITKQHMGRK